MITKLEQVQIIQDFFNANGQYKYHLIDEYSEIDEIKRHNEQTQTEAQFEPKKSTIYGIVQTLPSQLAPVENLNSIQSTQLVTFFVPNWTATDSDPLGVEAREIIQDINNIAMAFTGKSAISGTTSYVLAPSLPVVGNETNMLGYYAVDVSLSVGWQMMENGVISNAVELSFKKGEEWVKCTWLDMSIARTRIPEAVNAASKQELETHIIQQGLTINLALPLQKDTIAWDIYVDSLFGNVNKKYEIMLKVGEQVLDCFMVATQITTHMAVGQVGSLSVELSYAAQ